MSSIRLRSNFHSRTYVRTDSDGDDDADDEDENADCLNGGGDGDDDDGDGGEEDPGGGGGSGGCGCDYANESDSAFRKKHTRLMMTTLVRLFWTVTRCGRCR